MSDLIKAPLGFSYAYFDNSIIEVSNNKLQLKNLGTAQNYTIQPDATTGKDTFDNGDDPDVNYGTEVEIAVYKPSFYSYIEFDLTSIPEDSTITSAILSLWSSYTYPTGATDDNVTLKRIIASWAEETLTWNNHPSVSDIIVAGQISTTDGVKNDFDITDAIQNWLNGTWPNYGLRIEKNADDVDSLIVDSSDGLTAGERPELVIDYIDYNIPTYNSSSPFAYIKTDLANYTEITNKSLLTGSEWLHNSNLNYIENPDSETGSIKYKYWYSNQDLELSNSNHRTIINNNVNASFLTLEELRSEQNRKGRFRYILAQFTSDGSQACALGIG